MDYPKLIKDNYTLCPTCSLSKATIVKGKVSDTVYTSPLQLIQIDLCGPFRYENFTSTKYFMTVRDAYSRYYVVIHLETKGEAADKLINWIRVTENYFSSRGGFKVGAVRSDNGGEFMSTHLHDYFASKGIEHQLTVPYQSFQNGAVERAHRSIEQRARALLLGGKVPPSLWSEAVSCAVYLINRTPTSAGFIPFCKWFNVNEKDINIDNLRIFGLYHLPLPVTGW